MINGPEYDALTKARKHLVWHPGEVAEIKRRYRRRARGLWAQLTEQQKQDALTYRGSEW